MERNAAVPAERRIACRMGINISDVIVEGGDIYGDGVDVAARIEVLADPGGICIARNVFNQAKGKLDLAFEHPGEREIKNISEPVSVRLVDTGDFDAFNTVYRSYFGTELPARACVRADLLGPYLVEIEIVAAADHGT
jgi:class 3 adenylate cyclase